MNKESVIKIVIGIILIITSVFGIRNRLKGKGLAYSIIGAAIALIIGIFLIANQFTGK